MTPKARVFFDVSCLSRVAGSFPPHLHVRMTFLILSFTFRNNEKLALRRQTERREQYRQVRAHVEKDDGRLRAYGWSLPAKVTTQGTPGISGALTSSGTGLPRPSSAEPVPVPVYCRPLTETEPGVKVWHGP